MIIKKIVARWQRSGADSRDLLAHSVVAFSVRILGALSAFLMSIVLARVLGAEESGFFFLGFTVVTILATFSRLGLDRTVLRFTGSAYPDRDWGQIRSVLRKSLLLASVVGSVMALSLWFLADWLAFSIFHKQEMSPVLKHMSPGIIGLALFTLVAISLQGLHRVVQSVFTLNIGVNIITIIFLLVVVVVNSSLAAWYYSAATLITFTLGLLIWHRGQGADTRHSRIEWNVLFSSCMPLWIVMMMTQLVQWSGQLIAGAWVESSELAQLAVAQRTALLVSFILVAVNLVVAPRFAAMYSQGEMKRLKRLALTSVKMMVGFAFPVIVVILFFPRYIMELFGPDFSDGAHLLQILAIGQFISVTTGSVGNLLSMSGHERDLRNATLISGPVAVTAALILTPLLGVTGSAIATAFAVATQNLLAVWYVKKRLGFNTLAVWKKA